MHFSFPKRTVLSDGAGKTRTRIILFIDIENTTPSLRESLRLSRPHYLNANGPQRGLPGVCGRRATNLYSAYGHDDPPFRRDLGMSLKLLVDEKESRVSSKVMTRPAGRIRRQSKPRGSSGVESGGVANLTGRVGSGRVGSGRVGSGRVRRFSTTKSHGFGSRHPLTRSDETLEKRFDPSTAPILYSTVTYYSSNGGHNYSVRDGCSAA